MTEILCKWLNNDVKLSKKIGTNHHHSFIHFFRDIDTVGSTKLKLIGKPVWQSYRSGCLIHNGTYLTLSLTLTITLTLITLTVTVRVTLTILTLILDTVVNKAPTSVG